MCQESLKISTPFRLGTDLMSHAIIVLEEKVAFLEKTVTDLDEVIPKPSNPVGSPCRDRQAFAEVGIGGGNRARGGFDRRSSTSAPSSGQGGVGDRDEVTRKSPQASFHREEAPFATGKSACGENSPKSETSLVR